MRSPRSYFLYAILFKFVVKVHTRRPLFIRVITLLVLLLFQVIKETPNKVPISRFIYKCKCALIVFGSFSYRFFLRLVFSYSHVSTPHFYSLSAFMSFSLCAHHSFRVESSNIL